MFQFLQCNQAITTEDLKYGSLRKPPVKKKKVITIGGNKHVNLNSCLQSPIT